jgi:hypothetical protein
VVDTVWAAAASQRLARPPEDRLDEAADLRLIGPLEVPVLDPESVTPAARLRDLARGVAGRGVPAVACEKDETCPR